MSQKTGNLLIIGISGVTCGGKTSTANQLKELLKIKVFSQDDYFRDVNDPNHVWIPELGHINFDILSSLNMEKMHSDVLKFIKENGFVSLASKKINNYRTKDFESCLLKVKKSDTHILIIEGFSIFNYKPWLDLFNLKYYFVLDKEECYNRRIKRVYEPPDCPGYFEKCAWPEHLKQKREVEESVTDVTYFEPYVQAVVEQIVYDISDYL